MSDEIQALNSDQLRKAEGTPGLDRRVAFEDDGYWFGHVDAAAETMSGWHHHGDNVTIGYVLRGQITLESGPGGDRRVEVGEGEYFIVPKQLVHREGNMSTDTAEIILTRAGEGPVVFPVDGPEPGSP